ncbi:Maf-like protein [Rhizobium sp. SAFR-030]|uniref:Maf-like protein n=1 Tax=Rhizobium sp. SAFR-030 TaxID=3387277 RepID=UPI003F801EB3
MENAGLVFQTRAASIDERAIDQKLKAAGATPQEVALALARAKALDVCHHYSGAFVIGSDQTMSLGERVYHKPSSRAEAREAILSLSGKTHHLNSGVTIARDGEVLWETVSRAALTVRPLTEAFVDRYLDMAGDAVLGSVGGYQLEGQGIQLFSAIDGDYFTILGLPMLPVLNALRELGAIDG